MKQAVVRGTTNPAPCCHLANDTDLLTPVLWAMAGDNKQIYLWPADPFTQLTQNLIRSSHGHSKPSLKISCKSVQPFSRNVADKETKKERNRPKTIPRSPTGGGVITKMAKIKNLQQNKHTSGKITTNDAQQENRWLSVQINRSYHHNS